MTEEASIPDWMEGVDPETASNLVAKGVDTPEKLVKAYNEMGTEIRSRPKPPGPNATQEDMQKFREKIGLIDPEKPGYEVPADLPEAGRELVETLTQTLPHGSMTDAEYRDWATKLASREASTRQEAVKAHQEAIAQQAEQSREQHGSDAIVQTEQFIDEFFADDPEIQKAFKKRAKHPKVVEAFSTLVAATQERQLPQHEDNIRRPQEKMTMAQMGYELKRTLDITNKPDFNRADPENAEIIAKQDRLDRIMYENGFTSPEQMIRSKS